MKHPLRTALSPLVLVLVGCASAPPPLSSPGSAGEPPPSLFGPSGSGTSPVDNDMLALAKSEEELDRLLPRAPSSKKSAPADGDAARADAPTAPSPPATAQSSTGEGCPTACRALTSMKTSADHLCSLAGEGDGRCEDARGRLRGATARVRSACPMCAAQP